MIARTPERPEAHRQPPKLPEGIPALRPDVAKSGLQRKGPQDEQLSHHQVHEHIESVSGKQKSPDVREALYGVEGALTRLERLSLTIRQASKGGLSRKVQTYAKNHNDSEFDRRIGLVLNWLFDRLDSGLAELLRKSIVYRRYRLLYQRRHRQRVQSERRPQPAPATSLIESKPTLKPALPGSARSWPSQKATPLESNEPQVPVAESVLESKSGRSTLDKGFNARNSQLSPSASEASGSSAAWTGGIDYPTAPKATPGIAYVQCPICYERYEASKFLSQRAWR